MINNQKKQVHPVTDTVQQEKLALDPVSPLELIYKNIEVEAIIEVDDPQRQGRCGRPAKKEITKTILKPCTGKFSPGTFTAIVGPSGCGKTTMLNLLSGRLLSTNLSLYGILSINGQQTDNVAKYKHMIGYVMQEDLMLATFTPTQTFKFIVDMRLPDKTQDQKVQLVQKMISSLGLTKCKDTYVGNNLIRGISGGQKKRTSIGVQMLINPSILFLDQPTTGLDSTTALNLIRLLNGLAKSGRTIISTIHQPSSQIFLQFDRLMLMVDGNIVYNGGAIDSISYFRELGMGVPVHSNPLDHYMKIMNKQGIALQYMERGEDYDDEQVAKEFQQKVVFLVSKYNINFRKIQKKISSHEINDKVKEIDEHQFKTGWGFQTGLIMKRSFINQFRNPMDMIAKVLQAIFFGVISIILYEKKGVNFPTYDQNLKGAIFFIVMTVAFGGIFGSVNAFNLQRPVFIRERLSNTYDTTSYFAGRSIATLPGVLIIPIIFISICYFVINLNNAGGIFFYTMLSACLISWMSNAYGLFLSALISDAVVVMALVPVLIVPLMLVAGFFTPLSNVHDVFRPFQYISVFKYGYQAMIQQQYIDGAGFTNYPINQYYNQDPNSILKTPQYNFQEQLWLNLFLLFIIGFALNIVALIALWFTSNPKRMDLLPPKPIQQIPQHTSQEKKKKGNFIELKASKV